MESLTVLYDSGASFARQLTRFLGGRAAPLCQWATRWLVSKPKLVQMYFVPAGSDEARRLYPDLDHESKLGDVTVIDDAGNFYQNEKAWVMCLWCLRDYRNAAERLSSPAMLPMTKRFVKLVSKYRPTTTDCEGSCKV